MVYIPGRAWPQGEPASPVFCPPAWNNLTLNEPMSDFISPDSGSSPSPAVVPHNREAEEAVIGAVLINPEAYYDVAQFLKAG